MILQTCAMLANFICRVWVCKIFLIYILISLFSRGKYNLFVVTQILHKLANKVFEQTCLHLQKKLMSIADLKGQTHQSPWEWERHSVSLLSNRKYIRKYKKYFNWKIYDWFTKFAGHSFNSLMQLSNDFIVKFENVLFILFYEEFWILNFFMLANIEHQ